MKQFVDLALKKGAEKAEAYYQENQFEGVKFEDNHLTQIASKKLSGLKLQVVKDGKAGSVASSNFSESEKIAAKALEIAAYGDDITYDYNKPGAKFPATRLTDERIFNPPVEEIVKSGERLVHQVLAYDKNIKVSCNINRVIEKRNITNSYGLDISSTKHFYYFEGQGFLVDGDNFISVSTFRGPEDGQIDFLNVADELVENMRLARITVPMESGKYPVIFTPKAVSLLAYTLLGFYGLMVARGVSPLKDKLNTQIFDEKLTLIDDGIMDGGYHSLGFDDEGTPQQRTVLVEKGVLKNFLHNCQSAQMMNTTSTGNSFKESRAYHKMSEISFSNLIINPGDTSFAEMVKEIKTGIILDDIFGLVMGNIVQGNIDTDIDMAYKIENGKIVGRVKNGALGTNIYQIFKNNLLAVENKTRAYTPGGFTVYAPHIMCKDVNVTTG